MSYELDQTLQATTNGLGETLPGLLPFRSQLE